MPTPSRRTRCSARSASTTARSLSLACRRSLACFPEAMVCSEAEFAAVRLSYDVLSSSMRREAYVAYLLCRSRQWELLCRLGWVQ